MPQLALVGTELLPIPPVKSGAIQAYIAAVAPMLASLADVTVFGPGDPALPDEELYGGVHYRRFSNVSGIDYYEQVALALSETSWDAVVVYNWPPAVTWLAPAAPEARLYLSIHNDMFHPELTGAAEAEACLQKVTGVITISQFIATETARRYPAYRDKLRPVLAGVALDRFRPNEDGPRRLPRPTRTWVAAHSPVVMCAARLCEAKGVHVLLDAFGEVRKRSPRAGLMIVGSAQFGKDSNDPYVAKLKAKASQCGDAVHFTGFVPYAAMPDYFAAAQILACPSLWEEPLARVQYEAMAAGLALVSSRRGGNGEVIREGVNGLTYKPASSAVALAEALNTLIGDPHALAEMGHRGRQQALARHGWRQTADRLAEIWLNIGKKVESCS